MEPKKNEALLAVDDVLNFILEDDVKVQKTCASSPSVTTSFSLDDTQQSGSFSEGGEEVLEWLSNKDAFPPVDISILADSPVSVLDNMNCDKFNANGSGSTVASLCESLKVPTHPVRPRSSRRRRRGSAGFDKLLRQAQFSSYGQVQGNEEASFVLPSLPTKRANAAATERKCMHCQTDKTPQWRAGPMGPKTLCNACGVRYKSGRLFPEYRPAGSPTFSSALHSNSHRKVVEMRRQKQVSAEVGVEVYEEGR